MKLSFIPIHRVARSARTSLTLLPICRKFHRNVLDDLENRGFVHQIALYVEEHNMGNSSPTFEQKERVSGCYKDETSNDIRWNRPHSFFSSYWTSHSINDAPPFPSRRPFHHTIGVSCYLVLVAIANLKR